MNTEGEQQQQTFGGTTATTKLVGTKPTLGSFPRSVGPAADIRELEYISALHQNAESFLRLDGTICSKDIAPYLSSRYGMEITPEQAVDIAVNLCGAKVRSKLSAEKDAQVERQNQQQQDISVDTITSVNNNSNPYYEELKTKMGRGNNGGDHDENEETVYYFDLVQLMSLLLIGELVELVDRNQKECGTNNYTNSNCNNSLGREKKNGTLQLINVVSQSITDVLGESMQQDLLNGKQTLDKETLAFMLEAFGDVDSANDEDLLLQMLSALGEDGGGGEEDGAIFSTETFLRALTVDVRSFSSRTQKISKTPTTSAGDEETEPLFKTSIFYDIFGRNWENENEHESSSSVGDMGQAPAPQKTASYIDYAADTYGSVVLNTAVWSLFLMTTLIYLNFFLTMLDSETSEVVCRADDNFGCVVGHKVFGWILTAFFCGLYGVCIIVPTSVGNVAGRTPMLYVTLLVTALYTYAPFTTLIWYREGIPYTVEKEVHYKIVCPAWIGDLNETRAAQEAVAELDFGAQYYMRLDSSCKTAENWCRSHPEIQGKYIDPDRNFLSYDEFEKCYSFFVEKLDGDNFIFPLWNQTGERCNPFNTTFNCPNKGACGLRSLSNANETLFEEDYICCHSGHAVSFQSARYQDGGYDNFYDDLGNFVCTGQPIGQACLDTTMCETGATCEQSSTCILPPALKNESGWLGDLCDRSNSDCQSGFCWNGTCQEMPTICPAEKIKHLGGLKLDPFCRTFEDWCQYTNLIEIQSAIKDFFGLSLFGEQICEQVLNLTVNLGLMRVLDETDAEIGYIYNTTIYSHVEDVLLQDWAILVLFSIAVVGFFALLAILRKVFMHHPDERRRDYKTKRAAKSKLINVIETAMGLHTQGCRGKGRVMRNFFLRGEERIEVGGLFWTFKNLWSGYLTSKEGIRYPGRIWVGQVAQIVVTIIGILFAASSIIRVGNEIDERREELGRRYSQEEVQGIPNDIWATITMDDLSVTPDEQAQLDFLPKRWMFDAAAIPGAVAGTLVALFCILVYIPSTTNTIMKLRNGQLPSLHDPCFGIYRKTPDNVVQNIGNMVFSLMGASVVMSILIFILVFVFAYQNTRGFVMNYVGIAIGILCTMIIKVIGQKLLRTRNFSCSFYRKKPKSANCANLFFECWYIGTGLLVVVTRMIMFLLSSALWLGRIDVEFLDPGVKIGRIGLDNIPTHFKRDILVHEAHSHPYIERLGAMYLLRLRDGDRFGSAAGTAWRCLFVSGLMPWIVKHKVNSNDNFEEGNIQNTVQSSSRRLSSARISAKSSEDVQRPRSSNRQKQTLILPSDLDLRSSRRGSFAGFQQDSIRSIISI